MTDQHTVMSESISRSDASHMQSERLCCDQSCSLGTCFQDDLQSAARWLEFGLKILEDLLLLILTKQPAVCTGGDCCYATSSCP